MLNTKGDTLFSKDKCQTIGIYGCNDTSGTNIRSDKDAEQFIIFHKDFNLNNDFNNQGEGNESTD